MKRLIISAVAALLAHSTVFSASEIVVNVKKKGAEVQPTMYGIFFEDINFAADGGLYAEMVKNRSFEYPQHLMGWRAFGNTALCSDGPFNRNPHYVRLASSGHNDKHTGLENEGYFGMSVKSGAEYRFSLWARCPDGGTSSLKIVLADNASQSETQEVVSCRLTISGKEWKKYTAVMQSPVTQNKLTLRLFLQCEGSNPMAVTDVEHVSLFPVDTWKGRENGMRKDLAQALADLKPGVFRFPGGCIVEGTDLATRYQWKNTVGPVENRPLNENRWHYTFTHRFFPDYYQSYGLGFYEFFLLCEDFGCEPLPILSCGLSCQFQNRHPEAPGVHVPLDSLDTYIDDALDLIEFANGAADTEWGRVRAEMGHPEPFNLKYIGIGNEQWDYDDNPAYTARLQKFLDVLRKAHPEITYIGSTGPGSEGKEFDMLQPKMKEMKVAMYDEHFYRPESWFLDHKNRHRYDNYDRRGPKVFAGEYACHGKGKKYNHFNAALLEAAFMTGIERNADIVHMATYAPLFAHIEGWQWRPDLIWYDNQRSVRTCSYYVQQLYSHYKGTHVLPTTMDGRVVAGDDDQHGLSASAVCDDKTGCIYIKVANTSDEAQPLNITLRGAKHLSVARVVTLGSADTDAENTLDNPSVVVPQERAVTLSGNVLSDVLQPKTFAVYIVTQVSTVKKI